jgi:hypothetical protein
MIDSLLAAEQDLRQIAEQKARDLHGALRLAAYTFAGEAFEEVIQADQTAVEHWSAEEWIAFLQEAAPVGHGWNDAKVLGHRLTEVTAERDMLLTERARMRERLTLLEERARTMACQEPCPPRPIPVPPSESVYESPSASPSNTYRFRWPKVPARPPARYARELSGNSWPRKGMALALIASGISLRREAQVRMAQRFGTTVKAGSMRRYFERLEQKGLLEGEIVRIHLARTKFLWLSRKGQSVCEACGMDLRETDYQRVLRLHGGESQRQHAAEVATFAFQARRREVGVEVVPRVEGPAAPDAVIVVDGTRVYVEVEKRKGREGAAKWHNQVDLQGFVALCTVTEKQQERIVADIKGLGLPGRATCLEVLMQDKEPTGELWTEEWA